MERDVDLSLYIHPITNLSSKKTLCICDNNVAIKAHNVVNDGEIQHIKKYGESCGIVAARVGSRMSVKHDLPDKSQTPFNIRAKRSKQKSASLKANPETSRSKNSKVQTNNCITLRNGVGDIRPSLTHLILDTFKAHFAATNCSC